MLLGTLSTSIEADMLTGKPEIPGAGPMRADKEVIQATEGTTRAG